MAQEADGGTPKQALGGLGVELVVTEGLEDHADMREVLLAGLGEDKDVVAVYLDEAAEHGRPGGGRVGGGEAACRIEG